MPHQWEPEEIVESPLALHLINEQFPEIKAKKICLLGAGWDNTAFLINEEYIFRFPRRKIAVDLLETEWLALPKLAPQLPVPIPVPKLKGKPTDDFPWPFIGYKMLEGSTACYVNLSEEERSHLAEPIARFLLALHSIDPSELSCCTISHDNRSRVDGALLTEKIKKSFEEMALLDLLEGREKIYATVDELQEYRAPESSTVVHGDFYVRHLLLDEEHALCGVIDWGDVHVGDPAIDLAICHSFLPREAHSKFKKVYGAISDKTWNLAKLRAMFSSTMLCLFGYHAKDLSLLREGLRSLKVMTQTYE